MNLDDIPWIELHDPDSALGYANLFSKVEGNVKAAEHTVFGLRCCFDCCFTNAEHKINELLYKLMHSEKVHMASL